MTLTAPSNLRVYIGYDSREDIAYRVARESLLRHSSIPLDIIPIVQSELRASGLYWRENDPLSSTEFSFTRFLVPHLAGYNGWAVFMDCDFLARGDIATITDYADGARACFLVKHDYRPPETVKMDGKTQQFQYHRKNWSSLMFINCGHEQVKRLTPKLVNEQSGMYLHQFEWLHDDMIGSLPIAFNYLEGWHTEADCPNPLLVHFTRGGPWFKDWVDVEYGRDWLEVSKRV